MTQYRDNLKDAVAASAAPYGYTLTIWASGGVSVAVLGLPRPGEVLLFLAGGVLAFLLVEIVAFRTVRIKLIRADPPLLAVWGNAHFLSAGAGVMIAWGAAELVAGTVAWPIAGFAATAAYLLLNALQLTLASVAEEGGPK